MKKNKKTRTLSEYEILQIKYPYTFRDSISHEGGIVAGFGLKEPELAESYALELLQIVSNLLENNYKIIECLARFIDDENCSYGEMELIKEGKQISEGIEKWKDYYLKGPGITKRTKAKDLIDLCILHMKLEHIEGRPYLRDTSFYIVNKHKKKNKSKILKNQFELCFGYNNTNVWFKKNSTNNK